MVETVGKKKKKMPNPPPEFEVTAKRTTKLGRYQTALWKWLKVIFWHYENLKDEVEDLKKTVKLIKKELDDLKKRLEQ
jgi:hypothetical protein